mgnify:CR=1 FL=1
MGKVLADVTQFLVAQVVTLTACFHRLDVDTCFFHSIEMVEMVRIVILLKMGSRGNAPERVKGNVFPCTHVPLGS